MFCQFEAWFLIGDYKIDKMSHCYKDSDEGRKCFSYDSASEIQDTEESAVDIIPRSPEKKPSSS